MSEAVSFGNIVNSLRAVRNDYNEHLKAVPQYEAFLLVESFTQNVAGKLQDVAPAMAAEVVEALETAKAKFRQHLTSVPEYRALLAIDKLINDVAADLGVQPATLVPVEMPQAAATDTTTTAVEEPPAAEQQVVTETAQAPSERPEAVAQADTTEAAPAPVDVVAQAEVHPELTAADAISQVQSALRIAEAAPDLTDATEVVAEPVQAVPASTTEPDAQAEAASPTPLQAIDFGREGEKAA